MLQGLDDIRVLLYNQYSKEYFLASLKSNNEEESKDRVTVEMMTSFFKALINQIVSAETQTNESGPSASSEAKSATKDMITIARTLRSQLANLSRTILDSLFSKSVNFAGI